MAEIHHQDTLVTVKDRDWKGAEESVPKLPLTEYGNIDITNGVPTGFIHVNIPRVGVTCKRLRIEYAKALVGWDTHGLRGSYKQSYPVLSGVVVRELDHQRLVTALADKAKKQARKIAQLPVLAALFTLNRRAKRCRDLAQKYYQERMHGLAGEMKREKDRIYDLKGQVLHHMVEAGILTGGKFHQFEFKNWAEVLEGDGYRFHRPCPPQESKPETELAESVEAKPKEASEPTLENAYEVVKKFLEGKKRANAYQWPGKPRQYRTQRWREEEPDDWYDDSELDDDDEVFP